MPCCLVASGSIIRRNTIALETRRYAVKTNNGKPAPDQAIEGDRGVRTADQDSIDPMREQSVEMSLFLFRILVCVAEDNGIVRLAGHFFRSHNYFGVKCIGYVGNDHPNHIGSTSLQAARNLVGVVVKNLHGPSDLFGPFRSHD